VNTFKDLFGAALASLFILGSVASARADARLEETARSMHEGIANGAPLVAERSGKLAAGRGQSGQSAEARLNIRLSRAPALDAIEDIYVGCIVRHALVYGVATKEPSASVADAAVMMCDRERAGLVKGYRLALWSVMNVSVAQADDPAFSAYRPLDRAHRLRSGRAHARSGGSVSRRESAAAHPPFRAAFRGG
jgi:hypothetical protein